MTTTHFAVLSPARRAYPETLPSIEAATAKPDYRSLYVSSVVATTMLFLFGVGVPCWLFLDDALGGFGLGAMCAVWGGPGFGVMAASARISLLHEANSVDS